MSSDGLEVRLTVQDSLLDRASPATRESLVDAVAAAVVRVCAALGLHSRPRVSVVPGDVDDVVDAGPFALSVPRHRCPVRVGTLGAALQTVLTPTDDLATTAGVLDELAAGADERFARLVERWCEGVLDGAPALLLTEHEARERSEQLGLPPGEAPALRELLAHRVSLTRALQSPYRPAGDGASVAGWREDLLAQAMTELSLRFHPELLRRLSLDGDLLERSVLGDARQSVFDDLGLLLPPFRLVADPGLPDDGFAFDVGDLTTPPGRALPRDWRMVPPGDDDGEEPAARRQWVDPLTSRRTVIGRDAEGIGGFEYVARALGAAVSAHAPCFVTTSSVDQALELTAAIYPVLADAVRSTYGPAQLAGLLRELARDGVSLRHLPPMLQQLDEIALGLAEPSPDVGTSLRAAAAWATSDALRREDVALLTLTSDAEAALIDASREWTASVPPSDRTTTTLHRAYRDRWQEAPGNPPALLAHEAPAVVGRALRAAYPSASVLGPVDVVPPDLVDRAEPLALV